MHAKRAWEMIREDGETRREKFTFLRSLFSLAFDLFLFLVMQTVSYC